VSATVLERILAQTRQEVARRKLHAPLDLGSPPVRADKERRFHEALCGPGIGVIAEFKRRSPSAGELAERPQLEQVLRAYELGGAVALSILTEGPNFHGALEDLRVARAVSDLPLLRKDFIVDPYQLYESLGAGADAVLLIVAALQPQELALLYRQAQEIGLDVLVEVHDREELDGALAVGAELIGINNRDLRDFSVDVGRTEALMGDVPPGVSVVSESGVSSSQQLARLRKRGVQAVLVGETLMRARDPTKTLTALLSG
jgi:indole-3-glycerol phosphate synthase